MPDAPIRIKSGSFIIESDEPLNLTQIPTTEQSRRYTYERQSTEESVQNQEINIRYIVVRNTTTGEEDYKREYRDKECEIDIYWERPKPPASAA